jgi:hypothetical protein
MLGDRHSHLQMNPQTTIAFDFESATDFLHALLPTSEVWRPGTLAQNIFRGHANAEWPLTPTALRNSVAPNHVQRATELGSLRAFWIEADRQGLNVPGDQRDTRELWISPTAPGILGRETLRLAGRTEWANRIAAWPPRELWDALALAQHYGVPTRFLDWTRLPLIAAYFAAAGACEQLELGAKGRLAVWACHENVLFVSQWASAKSQLVHLVSVPRGGNPNLNAQHGVFTLVTPFGTDDEPPEKAPVNTTPIDAVLADLLAHCRSASGNMFTFMAVEAGPPLRKLTLPLTEAPQLFDHLSMLGVSGASLFPGFGGAARGAKEAETRKRLLAT